MNVPKSAGTSTYGSRYSNSSTSLRTPAATSTASTSASISYLSASDFRARSLSKAKEEALRKSNEKELEQNATESSDKPQSASSEESDTDSETEEEDDEQPETFVYVSVCTRATSPTPPGAATTVHRTRRIDIAKTIEKTVQRSTRKKKTAEKEIQSDRLDDSTRYSPFWFSYKIQTFATQIGEIEFTTIFGENLSAHKPPAPPKAESPVNLLPHLRVLPANCQQRFSQIGMNVGPTDRPRKSRTPSTGTDSDLNTVEP
ncbi:hypothetical protein DOY81_010665 [Sarcophaga bullata]|nr:hypothetical protein DOY81_010665 [Sarcophaga bullata]